MRYFAARPRSRVSALIVLPLLVAVGCGNDASPSAVKPDELGRCDDFDELRKVYWGDPHVHTTLSLDANSQGTRTAPADAYAFAKGQPIGLQPYDEDGEPSRMAQIDRPLDFVMVSDHAEFLSTLKVCNDAESPAYNHSDCVEYRNGIVIRLNALTAVPPEVAGYPALCGQDDVYCLDAGMAVWGGIVEAAEAAYDRTNSCQFTAFAGYEWTGGPGTRNLHRNVMFVNESVTGLPYSYFDEPYVEGLWARLQEECIDAGTGCDVLTIPHNSNLSNGLYFENKMANGQPFTADYVATRNAMEPVIEIYQHKGASECLPGETVSDELCGFEILPFSTLANARLELFAEPAPRDFLRAAYGEGMKFETSLGANPFQYGITAASDTHVSAPGSVVENDFKGHGGAGQGNRDEDPMGFPDVEYLSPGGLTAVWAEENARVALFSAMRRKETFGTSGPRIVARFFAGWGYPDTLCDSSDFVQTGYEDGVPMGGTLPAQPMAGVAPTFAVSAIQDVGTPAHPGTPLQRIQIVKGWLDGDDYRVQVYEVAGNPDNGASVDLNSCEPQGEGFGDLCTVWQDQDFDPSQRSYYYARIIENPTCRWTTYQCVEAKYDCTDWSYDECQTLKDTGASNYTCDCCDPAVGLNVAMCDAVDCTDLSALSDLEQRCCYRVDPAIQERAWTSPIWYQPPS